MKPLVVMGLRTLAHLDAKESMYEQIDRDEIQAMGRFPVEQLEAIARGFALGILSSHSVARIERVVGHLGWSRLFPTEHLISTDPLDRKDATNWEGWRREYEARGLALHTVVDIGEVLVRNLAGSSVLADVDKYYVIGDAGVRIEGATRITALDQTQAYRQAVRGPRNRTGC
ncbi:MAG: hypothetical protein OXI19_07275 [Gemmatimonadota bacterium]|nr:hypothetical protein [Gemmatimonadota bacterium]MXW04028.1 hypothetical protein [Gemmatimonadota bacterium]MYB62925.1 hypothetical protein [Gemmatimonadota bacterium]